MNVYEMSGKFVNCHFFLSNLSSTVEMKCSQVLKVFDELLSQLWDFAVETLYIVITPHYQMFDHDFKIRSCAVLLSVDQLK